MKDKKIYKRNKDSITIFVPGYGGTAKEEWGSLVLNLIEKNIESSLLVFTPEINEPVNLCEYDIWAKEIESLLLESEEENYKNINIVSASSGALPVCLMFRKQAVSNKISKIIFLDPADYELRDDFVGEEMYPWSGHLNYNPTENTGVKFLKNLGDKTLAHVVHFTIRNYGPEGYIEKEYKNRDKNHPEGFTRLNSKMVKSFYENLNPINRGKYIEIDNLPHAINRDGNVGKNSKILADFIIEFINQ